MRKIIILFVLLLLQSSIFAYENNFYSYKFVERIKVNYDSDTYYRVTFTKYQFMVICMIGSAMLFGDGNRQIYQAGHTEQDIAVGTAKMIIGAECFIAIPIFF